MRELEQLCRPLVRSLCEYWYYACRGVSPDMEVVNHSLREHLIRIREQVEDDGRLKREFQKIEQPLVFFIDYTVKEGHFPFRDQWTEIARDYNELSGDEKFFDLLSESLDDPDSSEQLMMFYLFMGLGFDGCHVDDREYVQRRMKVCAARIQLPATDETLSSADIDERPAYFKNRRFRFFSVYTLLTILTLCLLGSLGWNFWVLYQETGDFRDALGKAANAAGKMSLSSSEKTAQKPQAQPTQQPVQPPEIKPMPQPTQQMDAQQLKQQMEASLMPQQDAGAAQPSSDVQMTQPPDAQTTQQPESLAQQLEALLTQQQQEQAAQQLKALAEQQQPETQPAQQPDAKSAQAAGRTAAGRTAAGRTGSTAAGRSEAKGG